jgi:hypothetical protein
MLFEDSIGANFKEEDMAVTWPYASRMAMVEYGASSSHIVRNQSNAGGIQQASVCA